MSLYPSWNTVNYLEANLEWLARGYVDAAETAAGRIAGMIGDTGEAAVSIAEAYTDITANTLRNSLDTSLNWLSEYVVQGDDIIIGQVNDRIHEINARINEMETGVSGPAETEIIDAYESIGVAHEAASGWVTDTLESVSSALGDAYEFATDSVNAGMQAVTTNLVTTIEAILAMPETLITRALDTLIPAMSLENIANASKLLVSDPVMGLINSVGDGLKGVFADVLSIDEADVEKWAEKGLDAVNKVAASMLKEGETPLKFMR